MSHGLARAKLVLDAAKTASQVLTHSGFRLLTWDSPTVLKNFSESSDVFTCTIPGVYAFQFNLVTSTANAKFYPCLYKNGVLLHQLGVRNSGNISQFFFNPSVSFVQLAVGDTVAIYCYPVYPGMTVHPDAHVYCSLQAFFVGSFGPGVPSLTRPKLRATITSAAYTSGDHRLVAFDSPSINTAGFTESSDVFTCTIPGVYSVYVRLSSATAGTYLTRVSVWKNGVQTQTGQFMQRTSCLYCLIELAVGDTLAIYNYPNTSNTIQAGAGHELEARLI